MNEQNPSGHITRRQLIGASALYLGVSAGGVSKVLSKDKLPKTDQTSKEISNPNVTPLAQDYVVVEKTPDVKSHYIHDPEMTRLDNGHLFVITPARTRQPNKYKDFSFLSRSVDGGRNWETIRKIDFAEGLTWTDLVTRFKGLHSKTDRTSSKVDYAESTA